MKTFYCVQRINPKTKQIEKKFFDATYLTEAGFYITNPTEDFPVVQVTYVNVPECADDFLELEDLKNGNE